MNNFLRKYSNIENKIAKSKKVISVINNKVEEYELDKQIDESKVSNDGHIVNPFSTKDIKITNAIVLLPSLINRLKYDEIINPEFQRNANLWTNKQMSRLIESILLKLPLPVFYFDVSNPEKMDYSRWSSTIIYH